MGGYLADSLGISLNTSYGITESPVELELSHGRKEQTRTFEYDKGYLRTYFSEVVNSKASALGNVRFEEMTGLDSTRIVEAPNFIRLPYGSGTFLLHTTPYAFGNYYMLDGNAAYIEAVMSYLPDQSLYWDNYLKSGLIVIDSPLRFVLAQDPLRWAYYTGILGLLLFVLTRARRKQRIIPVMEPLKNSSVAFAQTVGDLYYQNRDYSDLIDKRQGFFRESLNERYRLNWSDDPTELRRKIALKSGIDEKQVGVLLKYMETLNKKSSHTQEDLMELHRLLQPFNL